MNLHIILILFCIYSIVYATNVSTFSELKSACDVSNALINVIEDITITSSITVAENVAVYSSNNRTIDGGGGYSYRIFNINENSIKFTLSNITIYNGRSAYGGAINAENTEVVISNVIFIGNYAQNYYANKAYGGAIYSSNSIITISDSYFGENIARRMNYYYARGGAIHLESSSSSSITNTIFKDNGATGRWGRGGAISIISSSTLELYNSEFSGNYDTYSESNDLYDSSGSVTCLSLCDSGQYDNTCYNNSASCEGCSSTCYLCSGTCQNCPTGKIAPKNGVSNSCTACSAGTYTTDNIDCINCPNKYSSDTGSDTCYKCPSGSISLEGDSSCELCNIGTYTIDNMYCIDCLPGYTSDEGSSNITDCYSKCNSGYKWDNIYLLCIPCKDTIRCPDGLTCSKGYEGMGCSNCKNNYFTFNNYCQKCPNNYSVIYIILGVVFMMFCIVIYKFGDIDFDTSVLAVANISITYFQIVTIITSLKYNIPNLFVEILNWLQMIFNLSFISLITSPECEINMNYYTKWILLSLFPIMIFVFLSLFLICKISDDFTNKIIKIMSMIVSIFYIFSITQTFKMWDCIKLDNKDYVLEDNPSIICFNGGKWTTFAIIASFMLLIYIFGSPLGLMSVISNSDYENIEKRFGWLFLKFTYPKKSWEFKVQMPKKFFMVFWTTFMPEQHSQSSMILASLLFFWYLHGKNRPYKEDHELYPKLENDLEHWLYMFEIILLIGMWVYSCIGGNENIAITIFLIVYFLGVFVIVYHIILLKRRLKKNEDTKKNDKSENIVELVEMSL